MGIGSHGNRGDCYSNSCCLRFPFQNMIRFHSHSHWNPVVPCTYLFHTNFNSQMWPMAQGILAKSNCKMFSVTNDLSHKIRVQRCLQAVATSSSVRYQMLLTGKAMHYITHHLCCTLCSLLSCINCRAWHWLGIVAL